MTPPPNRTAHRSWTSPSSRSAASAGRSSSSSSTAATSSGSGSGRTCIRRRPSARMRGGCRMGRSPAAARSTRRCSCGGGEGWMDGWVGGWVLLSLFGRPIHLAAAAAAAVAVFRRSSSSSSSSLWWRRGVQRAALSPSPKGGALPSRPPFYLCWRCVTSFVAHHRRMHVCVGRGALLQRSWTFEEACNARCVDFGAASVCGLTCMFVGSLLPSSVLLCRLCCCVVLPVPLLLSSCLCMSMSQSGFPVPVQSKLPGLPSHHRLALSGWLGSLNHLSPLLNPPLHLSNLYRGSAQSTNVLNL